MNASQPLYNCGCFIGKTTVPSRRAAFTSSNPITSCHFVFGLSIRTDEPSSKSNRCRKLLSFKILLSSYFPSHCFKCSSQMHIQVDSASRFYDFENLHEFRLFIFVKTIPAVDTQISIHIPSQISFRCTSKQK